MSFDNHHAHPGAIDDDACSSLPPLARSRATQFLERIGSEEFPCVGAKAALARGAIETHEFGPLASPSSDARLLALLTRFGARLRAREKEDTTVHSFVAIFSDSAPLTEDEFESQLWTLLQRLHHRDVVAGVPWADAISMDPDSEKFSLSLGGEPFFVIGLHPHASRLARRFATTTLVFNSHHQFEELRDDGRYQKMQAATRARDVKLQGSINPNLADFGSASEARQYSGREVDAAWKCPFHVETVQVV